MKRKYSDEFYNFVKKNIKGTHISDLVDIVNKKFNMLLTYDILSRYCKRKNLKNGIDTRFKKGHIPDNKGKGVSAETYEKCKATMFKKGHKPANYKPIGSERIDKKQGYILIKIADPGKWVAKHKFLYEKTYGKIPKGKMVTFKDGNKLNFDLDNLICISRAENVVMNRWNLRGDIKEVTEIGINIAKIKTRISKIKKSNKERSANDEDT